jgi:ethanolamine utilization protein EutA (predicted chaperonin)
VNTYARGVHSGIPFGEISRITNPITIDGDDYYIKSLDSIVLGKTEYLDTTENKILKEMLTVGKVDSNYDSKDFIAVDDRLAHSNILDLIDLERANSFTESVLELGDVLTNDLIKMKYLSGGFYYLFQDKFIFAFSGMILPGQSTKKRNFKVSSCFHCIYNSHLNSIPNFIHKKT